MTSFTPTFNLVDEPWIRVRDSDDHVHEVSLLELFDQAPRLRGLAGEIATQDVAVLRLLEAVILGASRVEPPRHVDESKDLWAAWWRAKRFPDQVEQYLVRNRERFFLFHPERPFMQVAGLHTDSGNASGLVKLIADVPDGRPYFTTRGGRELESLSFAEAARWLVHCHAFDPAGIKTGAVGDSRVKGGKGYSMGYPAWAGNLGIVIAEGSSLLETLLFNCPLALVGDVGDRPVWERPPLESCVAHDHPAPLGPADLLTWPSRRILLHRGDGRVVEVQISNGDPLGPQNQVVNESMSAWHRSSNQSKKAGQDVYMPTIHTPERRIWQGLASLLVSDLGESQNAWVVKWLGELRYDEILPASQSVRLHAVGIEYGPQASSIAGMVDDSLRAHVVALTHPVLATAAVDGAKRASSAVTALANLASDLVEASGGDGGPGRARVFELGYSLLDDRYRDWLAALDDPDRAVEALDEWSQTVRRVLIEAAYRLISDAGPAAQIGRQVTQRGSDDKRHMDAALAEIRFRAAVNKALGIVPSPVQPQEARS